jgi:hypothetical protein
MKTYQFLVECIFICLPDEDAQYVCGYFATVTVRGFTPQSAANQVLGLLIQRMKAHGITITMSGMRRTQCRIDEFWELTDDVSSDAEETGFSFFRMGTFSKYIMPLKFWWIRLSKPHMLIDLSTAARQNE